MASNRTINCPACGMPISEGASFCDACGAEIHAAAEPASKPCGDTKVNEGRAVEPGSNAAAGGLGSLKGLLAGLSYEQFQRLLSEVQTPAAQEEPPASWTPATANAPAASEAPAFPAAATMTVPEPQAPKPSAAPVKAPAASPRTTAAPASRSPAPTAGNPDMPFDFEWDNAREFIEGVLCNFAFRIRVHAYLKTLTIKADVGGETIVCKPFTSLCEGDERNGTIPFIPKMAGALSVRVLAEAFYKGGCRESFEAVSPFEHQASPFRRFLSDGYENVNIDIRDNTGLIRLDELKLPSQAMIDLKGEIDRALSHRDGWGKALLASNEIGREVVNLCAGERMLTVASGANPVSFGRSSHRAIQLLAETDDGQIDEYRSGFISGVHFTLINCNSAIMLRDGGFEENNGRKVLRKSKNRVSIDGRMISSDQRLSPGKTYEVVLAPNVVPGGAVTISLDARGHSSDISRCDRSCELDSVAIRRDDIPDRAVLVIWGAAEIDDFLGTGTGFHVGLVRGRLRLIRPDGSSERLIHLVGKDIPGTDIYVQ